jgi:hypothetical protein
MSYKNYKKSKLGKLRSFCAVVENQDSILKASEAIMISSSSVSKDISSLEKDLGYKLFDRIKNKLLINKNGQEYYKIAKNIILDLEQAYSRGLDNVDKSEISKILRKKKIEIINKKLDNWKIDINKILNKMLVRITWKKVISFFAICILGWLIWAQRTNYWFDRDMKNNSSIFLKDIIENGYYRIPRKVCPFETYEFYRDLYDLSFYLIKNKDTYITEIGLYDCPSTTMRMNGLESNDKKFYDKNFITCDLENRFKAHQYEYKIESSLLEYSNFNIYSLYRKVNCINYKTFKDNLNKYNNLHGIQVSPRDVINIANAAMFIIKKNKYYYLISETNGKQAGVDLNSPEERYLIFKKLTLEQLKTFDNGSYWKLIKEYNIKID